MLTVLDTGQDGCQRDEHAQATMCSQENLVVSAAIPLCVKHSHQNQASSSNRVHDERRQDQRGVPQLIAGSACSPVSPGRKQVRWGREETSQHRLPSFGPFHPQILTGRISPSRDTGSTDQKTLQAVTLYLRREFSVMQPCWLRTISKYECAHQKNEHSPSLS